jgi:hypothetical protein
MPLILGANSVSASVEMNSLRFNVGSSDSLERTVGSGGSTTTGTISFWVKRGDTGATQYFYANKNTVSNAGFGVLLSSDSFYVFQYDGTSPFNPANYQINLITSSVFRDYSAWYHFVLVIDTSNGTEANRIRLYVNGTQQTLNKTGNMPTVTLNLSVPFLYDGGVSKICSDYAGGNFFGGYLSEFNLIDGQALAPSDFGEFDSDSGIWKPIAYTGTYGTNGFYLEFKDSSALGDDTSGQGNDFTVNNLTSIDQTTDTPTNNFATMNPLASQSGSGSSSGAFTFSNGNLSVSGITSETGIANFGVSTGKWFWEVKVVTDQNGLAIGACNEGQNLDDELGYQSGSSQSYAKAFGYYGDNGNKFSTMGDGSQMSAYGDAISVNDIIGVAMNLDDNEVTFYLDGVAQGTFSITALGSGENYFPAVGNWSVATIATDFNFGNPPFAITTGNADANGYGNFEYEVPPGYYALNTKNLAEYG